MKTKIRKNIKRIISLLITLVMVVSCFTACGAKDTETSNDAVERVAYPLDTDVTVTYWMELNSNVAVNYNNIGETEFGKKLQEETGVTIEFQHPVVGQTAKEFNLLLGKTELPDVIEYSWLSYPGGPEKAIEDGVIIPLNDIIDKYCPNLKAYLEANPEIDKMVKTDDGTYYCFPFIRGGDKLLTSMGPMLRGDWLEELELEVPTTIEEWETVLTAFKEEKGVTVPFSYQWSSGSFTNNNPFAYAYGVTREFYLDDNGKVVYGAVQDGYKEYLMTMNKWMQAGLIDSELFALTGDQVEDKITNGTAGASFAYCGSNLGNWIKAGQAIDSNYTLVAAPYPTLVDGEKPEMGHRDNNYVDTGSAAITTTCENVEIVARLLDYGYSEAGTNLFNFGTEDVSYTLVDGQPIYTDLILNNSEGLSVAQAIAGYARACYSGPFVQVEAYAEQYYTTQEQKDASAIWADTNMEKHMIPPITATLEESKEMAIYLTDITAYRDRETIKFINGERSFDEWDDYVAIIEGMGLAKVLELKESAIARYNSR